MTQATAGYDPTSPYTAPQGQTPGAPDEYAEIAEEMRELGWTPELARQALNRAIGDIEASSPGAPPAASRPSAAPPNQPARTELARGGPAEDTMTRADFEAEMAHQRCVQALQYDPATGDVARAWVTSYRQRSTANGQPISIEQAYQTFDLWNRRRGAAPGPHPTAPPVTGARAAAPATVPAATGPAGVATYVPPAQPPGAYPPGSIPNQPGVVPPTTAMYPTLPAGQPGNPAQTALNLEAAAQAREAARMAGTPGYGAGGGARPTGGQPVDQEFEDLGLRAPHSAEFLDRVDDSEVARQLAAEAGGQF